MGRSPPQQQSLGGATGGVVGSGGPSGQQSTGQSIGAPGGPSHQSDDSDDNGLVSWRAGVMWDLKSIIGPF